MSLGQAIMDPTRYRRAPYIHVPIYMCTMKPLKYPQFLFLFLKYPWEIGRTLGCLVRGDQVDGMGRATIPGR